MENIINQFMKEAHFNAIKNGFYGNYPKDDVYEKLKEEIEEFKNSEPSLFFSKDSEQSEIADIIITLLAYCGEMNYDIETHIREKIDFNKTRNYEKEASVKNENEIAKSDSQLDIF